MREHGAGEQQLDFEACGIAGWPATPRPAPCAKTDMHIYGDDFALVRVRDGFYSDERHVFYVSRGRVYLPEEDMARFPGSREAIAARCATPAFAALLAFEVERTRAFFARGLPLATMVEGRLAREVRLFARGGLAILDRIEAVGYDVFARRPALSRADLARLVLQGLWR